jgi:diguanylate cyclase (GGDEF)-like protein
MYDNIFLCLSILNGENFMNLAQRIDNNIIAIVISTIFLMNISARLDRKVKSNKTFFNMFKLNTFQLIVETLTCIIDKQPFSWLVPVAVILHVILFIAGPIVAYLWYKFTYLWVNENNKFKFSNSNRFIMIPAVVNALVVLVSSFFNSVFYIAQGNVYTRGVLFFIPIITSYFYLIYSFIYIIANKKKIRESDFHPLLLFGIFPAIGGLIQSLFYGILLMWSSIAFSLIITYIYLQQEMAQTDYLTGAWTREKLNGYLNRKIRRSKCRNFSLVFLDLDNFKKINDTFGHTEGDRALKSVVQIVSKVLRKGDSITRYGGDEFVIFLNTGNKEVVRAVMKRISNAFEEYSNNSEKSYKLEFSYGYETYDADNHMSARQYINYVDKLMYKAKNNKKSGR